MRGVNERRTGLAALAVVIALLGGLVSAGCAGSGNVLEFVGTPFTGFSPSTSGVRGPGTTGRLPGGTVGGGVAVAPCDESQTRKFVRISMRNQSDDYVHYFLVMIAFIDDPTTAMVEGAVCPDDIPLYTSRGYVSIPAGAMVEFGHYCLGGPLLYYLHENGQFRGAGTAGLASAIAPAQGATPTYDTFFTSTGAQVPVPDLILFYNPGTTADGRALKISRNGTAPCNPDAGTAGDPDCQQDAFYYVDENDRLAGSTALGSGSGRRVPTDIQGTGCECLGLSLAYQVLAPPGRRGVDPSVVCNEFFRGGRIDYVFVREDTEPSFPQLVWRVTDGGGTRAHDFDPRARVP